MNGCFNTLFGHFEIAQLKVSHSLAEERVGPSWPDLNCIAKKSDCDVISA